MSSWVSHLPPDRTYAAIVGHGMNAEELAANSRLDRCFVQDLNCGVTCRWRIDHSTRRSAVTAHNILAAGRGLYRGAQGARARCPLHRQLLEPLLPDQGCRYLAVAGHNGHAALVRLYLELAGFSQITADVLAGGRASDPLIAVTGRA